MYFSAAQVVMANRAFQDAEQWTSAFFRHRPGHWSLPRYDVKTRPLAAHEMSEEAFAQLCRYEYERHPRQGQGKESFHFYHVCLQDDVILDAVERAHSFIKFRPLLQYIATHELVHMIRFDMGMMDFDAPSADKQREEERVHAITRHILEPFENMDLKLVIECFSDQYQIWQLTSH